MSSFRISIFALVLTIMLSLTWASQLPNAFVPYLEPNLSVELTVLNSSGPGAYLLTIEGQETLVAAGGSDALVSDEAAIRAALQEDVVRHSGYLAALQEARLSLSDLQAGRVGPETNCTRLSGMDRFPCTDHDSCVRAAFANPLAADYVNAPGFWQAMLRWQNERTGMNSSLNELQAALDGAGNDSDSAGAIADKLSVARAKTAFFLNNSMYRARPKCNANLPECKKEIEDYCYTDNLYTCFEYCPLVPFDAAGWETQEARLRAAGAALNRLSAQEARAQTIVAAEEKWVNFTNQKGARFAQVKSAWAAKQSELEAGMKNASGRWNDTELEGRLTAWKNSVADARAMADGGQFYRALGTQAGLDNEGAAMGAKISANDLQVKNIENSFKSIQLSIDALSRNGTTADSQELAQSQTALKSQFKYPADAAQLGDMEDNTAKLEQQALAQVARKQLGVSSPSKNAGASPGQTSGNGTAGGGAAGQPTGGTGASAGNGAGSFAPDKPKSINVPLPSNCPLPIGLALGALLISLGMAKPKTSGR